MMKRTLVLAVDRDDDYGVKGRVITPVVGIENCISAANALGIADPEDSDVNALYAAISTCMDLQEDGIDAEVALICGNEKVGHKSDLEVVAQLERVLDEIKPDNVVLIGDGAEDEYIYPIISSRSHVDSVRKVYVKQAPNIESSFYVITKILSEPNKRKRFVAPIGVIITLIALFILVPDIIVYLSDGDVSNLTSISRDLILLAFGLIILLYGYSVADRWSSFNYFLKDKFLSRGILLAMTALSLGIMIISAIVCYYELNDTYFQTFLQAAVYYCQMMVWPIILGMMVYIIGQTLNEVQEEYAFRISNIFDCVNLASVGLVLTGLFDIVLYYIYPGYEGYLGVIEIIMGIVVSLASTLVRNRVRPDAISE